MTQLSAGHGRTWANGRDEAIGSVAALCRVGIGASACGWSESSSGVRDRLRVRSANRLGACAGSTRRGIDADRPWSVADCRNGKDQECRNWNAAGILAASSAGAAAGWAIAIIPEWGSEAISMLTDRRKSAGRARGLSSDENLHSPLKKAAMVTMWNRASLRPARYPAAAAS
jgi:hypothetical protein